MTIVAHRAYRAEIDKIYETKAGYFFRPREAFVELAQYDVHENQNYHYSQKEGYQYFNAFEQRI
jgi:hypothetical protein